MAQPQPCRDVPNKVFHHIMGYLGPADLWMAMSVCRLWRQLIKDNKFLWTHFDITMFKPEYLRQALARFLRLASGSTTSLQFIHELPFKRNPAARKAFKVTTREHFYKVARESPKLNFLMLSIGHRHRRDGIQDKAALTCLSLKIGNQATIGYTTEILADFPNLKELSLLDIQHHWNYAWPTTPHPALKSVLIQYSPTTRPEVAAIPLVVGTMRNAFLVGLAQAAPNLENLELHWPHFVRDGHSQTIPNDRDFGLERLLKLRVLVLKHVYNRPQVVPRLPGSLEKLVMHLARTALGVPWSPQNDYFVDHFQEVQRLPNLKELDINFDNTTKDCVSTWCETVRISNCKLKTLQLDGGRKPVELRKIESQTWYGRRSSEGTDPGCVYSSGWLPTLLKELASKKLLDDLNQLGVHNHQPCSGYQAAVLALADACHNMRTVIWHGRCDTLKKSSVKCLLDKPGVKLELLHMNRVLEDLEHYAEEKGILVTGARQARSKKDQRKNEMTKDEDLDPLKFAQFTAEDVSIKICQKMRRQGE